MSEPAFGADQPDHRIRRQTPRHRDGPAQCGRPRAPRSPPTCLDNYIRRSFGGARPFAHRQMPSLRQCIGAHSSSTCWKRRRSVAACVLMQPIGRVGPMGGRTANFNGWAETVQDRSTSMNLCSMLQQQFYAPGFVYCADRDFVKGIKAPCLVLAAMTGILADSEELAKFHPRPRFRQRMEDRAGADLGQGGGQGVPRRIPRRADSTGCEKREVLPPFWAHIAIYMNISMPFRGDLLSTNPRT